MESIKEILQSIGYDPKDFGEHYRCRAVYRNGGNDSAILVHKNSGVFIDYGNDSQYLPLKVLIERTIGEVAARQYLQGKKVQLTETKTRKSALLSEEKSYSQECLRKLLPSHSFYLERGISMETQKFYKCGLATQKDFYKRIVFPIIREDQRIHGFSGRAIDPNNEIKWLHKGKKQNWLYPFFLKKHEGFPVIEAIKKTKQIITIESIGDSMALYQNGYANNCVSFGLSLSPVLISRLLAFELDKVVLAFNDDKDKEKNNGEIGLVKNYLKNFATIGFEKMYWIKPLRGDFGEMQEDDWKTFGTLYKNLNHESCVTYILDKATNMASEDKVSAAFKTSLKKLEQTYNFYYD